MDKKEIANISKLTYEEACAELENIIAELEGGNNSLDESITRFERGRLLTKHCTELLNKAELKIRNLAEEESDGLQVEVDNES